jgi:hypothetical protein
VSKEVAHKDIESLTIVDSIIMNDIVGNFCLSNGFGGYTLILDSGMTFRKIDFSCVARFAIDSGTWVIKDQHYVVFKSAGQTLNFEVVKFDRFYFLVPPAQKEEFTKDLQAIKDQFRNMKPITVSNRTYSKNYLIGYKLKEKYFSKELEDAAGAQDVDEIKTFI